MRVQGLGCAVNSRVLLADVDLEVGEQPLALLGPSGAGKSLALRCLLGLAPAGAQVSGAVVMDDGGEGVALADRRGLAALRGRGLTLLPQAAAASLDPVRRVEAQLRELLRVHRNDGDTPGSLLALVGLEATLLRSHPHELSGGQAQRVALALALACRPRVLLADEPTAALDNLAQAQLLGALQETCAARGTRLVLVTHDLALAARLCASAVVLAGGRVVESGSLLKMMDAPGHTTTRALVDAARRADGLWAVPGDMS